jgi:hypothetical protein
MTTLPGGTGVVAVAKWKYTIASSAAAGAAVKVTAGEGVGDAATVVGCGDGVPAIAADGVYVAAA